MSLLIKGMDMPIDCAGCDLSYYRDGYNGGYGYSPSGWRCRRLNHIIKEGEETRPSDCPLFEIPTPHGDLIDKDPIKEFITDGINRDGQDSYGYTGVEILTEIEYAPTIIEAEGKS